MAKNHGVEEMTVPKKSKTKTFYFKNVFQQSVLISTGDQQIDVSSYLTPKSANNDFTWEETDTDYVFKLQLFWKPGWGSFFLQTPAAAEDPRLCGILNPEIRHMRMSMR